MVPGSVSSRSRMESTIVGKSEYERPVAPGPPWKRVSPENSTPPSPRSGAQKHTEPGEWPEAVALLGGSPKEVWRSPDRYGIYLFASETEVRALSPDFKGLAALGDDQFICTAPGDRTDVVSRVFVPGAGVDEDSVTGSAHAALTPFWAARLGRERFTAHQASARGGDLVCRLEADRAWLGGHCVTVVEGTFYIAG